MESFFDFLANNYLIFLLISLILIFALIGYLVDSKKKEGKEENINTGNIGNDITETVPVDIQEELKSLKNVSLTTAVNEMKDEAVKKHDEEKVAASETPVQSESLGTIPTIKQEPVNVGPQNMVPQDLGGIPQSVKEEQSEVLESLIIPADQVKQEENKTEPK